MKKTWIFLAVMAIALVSCNKETIDNTQEESEKVATEIVFNLTANHPDAATKAVKTGWEAGDVIFVFLNKVAAPKYLKMSYGVSGWTFTQMNGDSEGSLGLLEGDEGSMRAIYMPFANDATVSADGTNFKFNKKNYSYYLTGTLNYTVVGGEVSGAFNMQIPDGYVQFFLDDASATPETAIQLREPHLTPQAINYIAANGAIDHTTLASGAPMTGYVYDKAVKEPGESKGYLFSGLLAAAARNTSTDYHFTLVSGGWQGSYYYKEFADRTWYRGASSYRALKMPALGDWTPITDYKPIDLGTDVLGKRIYWCSRNIGASADVPAGSTLAERQTTWGDYFSWGETAPYYTSGHAYDKECSNWTTGKDAGYAWGSYVYSNESTEELTKYCNKTSNGYNSYTDELTELVPADDAAAANLAGIWRMPTNTEWTYLKNNLTSQWDPTNKGYVVYETGGVAWTTPTIFLPAAGVRFSGNRLINESENGYYWSSSLYTGLPTVADNLQFTSTTFNIGNATRYWGSSVRAVTE